MESMIRTTASSYMHENRVIRSKLLLCKTQIRFVPYDPYYDKH